MRLGDWIVCVSMGLNFAAMCAYAWQGNWNNAGYWFAALQLNFWIMRLK